MASKGGRPKKEFDREQVDRAKELLGRRVYPSRVATDLRQEYADLTLPMSYRLIETARQEVFDALRGEGRADDPLTAQYLFLTSVIADNAAKIRDKVAASAVIIKLLGLNKILDSLGAGDVDEFLAGVLARRKARETAGPGES